MKSIQSVLIAILALTVSECRKKSEPKKEQKSELKVEDLLVDVGAASKK